MKKLFLLLFMLTISVGIMAQTNTWDGSSSNNWNTAANWSLNLVPTSAHDVVIINGATITVNTAAVCASLSINTGSSATSITMSSPNSLTISGTLVMGNGTDGSSLRTVAVGSGTLSCGSLTMGNPSSGNNGATLTISTGTATVTGDLTFAGSSSENVITFSGAGTLNVGGTFGSTAGFTASTGTVNFNGAGDQTIPAYTYFNLTASVGGTKTAASITFNNSTTSNRTLTVTSPAVLSVTGAITLQNAAGSNTVATITGTGTANCASLTVGGTTTTLSGDATTILTSTISTLSISGNLNLFGEDDGSDDNNSTFALGAGSVSVGGTISTDEESGSSVTLTLNTGAETGTLTLTGSTPFTDAVGTLSFDATGNNATVIYSGAAQEVRVPNSSTYTNLTISGSGTKTLGGSITVNGTLAFSSQNLNTGANTVTFGTSATLTGEAAGSYLVGNLTTVARTIGTGSFDFAGLQINTGSDDLGNVTLTRVSGIAPAGTGSKLNRYWDISSVSPPTAGRNITFSWVSDDNGDVDLSVAVVFKSTNSGTSWTNASAGGGQDVIGTLSITAPGVTAFSRWTVGDANAPLPVELTSFSASVKNYSVHLNWETATEKSNYGFDVERSADKLNWSKVAFVNGHGNSNSPKQYSYTDSKISSGKYYYRLKQIDTEGSFTYSKEIEVSTGELLKDFVVEQNFPNPFNPSTTIKFGFKEPVSAKVIIYNALGSEVATLFNERTEEGRIYSIDFDGSQLASGIYYYSVSGGNYNSVKKMILMK